MKAWESIWEISVKDDPDPVVAGEQITYTISVTNISASAPANGVSLTDILPEELSFEFASTGCAELDGVVACQMGDLG